MRLDSVSKKLLRLTRLRWPFAAVAIWAASLFPVHQTAFGATDDGNLLLNPSFEQRQDELPSIWGTSQWAADPSGEAFRSASDFAYTGQSSARIANNQDNDSRLWQDAAIRDNQTYVLSGWIRTDNVGTEHRGANLSVDGKLETSADLRGTSDWQYVELYLYAPPGVTSVRVTAGIGGYGDLNTGVAYFDDIRLEPADSVPAGAPFVQLGEASAAAAASNAQPAVDFGYHQGPSPWLYYLLAGQTAIVGSALVRLAIKRQ